MRLHISTIYISDFYVFLEEKNFLDCLQFLSQSELHFIKLSLKEKKVFSENISKENGLKFCDFCFSVSSRPVKRYIPLSQDLYTP